MKRQSAFVLFALGFLLPVLTMRTLAWGQTPPASQAGNRDAGQTPSGYMRPGKTAFPDTTPGIITTVVADRGCRGCSGGIAGDGGPARDAQLSIPRGIFIDPSG